MKKIIMVVFFLVTWNVYTQKWVDSGFSYLVVLDPDTDEPKVLAMPNQIHKEIKTPMSLKFNIRTDAESFVENGCPDKSHRFNFKPPYYCDDWEIKEIK